MGFTPAINKESLNIIVNQIRAFNGIDEIIYDYNQLLTILNIVNSGKLIIYILSILFTMISLFLIYSNNRFYLNSRAVHFNTMKLVGAKLSLIRRPMIIRGLLLGFIASLICAIVGNALIIGIKQMFDEFRYIDNFYYFNIIIFILGLLLGGLGSGLFVKTVTLSIDFKKKKFE
jgi:cell division transport system permease protein